MTYAPDSAVVCLVGHYSSTLVESDTSIEDITAMHIARGFRKAGYHLYIRKNGLVEKGRDLSQEGRFEIGAHSQGENGGSIGVCFEGGVTKARPNVGFDSRTPAQIKAMIETYEHLLLRFPNAIIKGHNEMPGAATQCPGHLHSAWWQGVVNEQMKPLGWARRLFKPRARRVWEGR